jgi:hypothetical protein
LGSVAPPTSATYIEFAGVLELGDTVQSATEQATARNFPSADHAARGSAVAYGQNVLTPDV